MSKENHNNMFAFIPRKYVFAFCIHPRPNIQFLVGFSATNINLEFKIRAHQ